MPPERLIDLALAIVAGEVVLLFVFRRRLVLRPVDVLGQVLAGVFLMLAVRTALAGADRRWTLACMAASFPAHLFDLARRRASSAARRDGARVSPTSPELPRPPRAGQS